MKQTALDRMPIRCFDYRNQLRASEHFISAAAVARVPRRGEVRRGPYGMTDSRTTSWRDMNKPHVKTTVYALLRNMGTMAQAG